MINNSQKQLKQSFKEIECTEIVVAIVKTFLNKKIAVADKRYKTKQDALSFMEYSLFNDEFLYGDTNVFSLDWSDSEKLLAKFEKRIAPFLIKHFSKAWDSLIDTNKESAKLYYLGDYADETLVNRDFGSYKPAFNSMYSKRTVAQLTDVTYGTVNNHIKCCLGAFNIVYNSDAFKKDFNKFMQVNNKMIDKIKNGGKDNV